MRTVKKNCPRLLAEAVGMIIALEIDREMLQIAERTKGGPFDLESEIEARLKAVDERAKQRFPSVFVSSELNSVKVDSVRRYLLSIGYGPAEESAKVAETGPGYAIRGRE